jgi:hypothetical protein
VTPAHPRHPVPGSAEPRQAGWCAASGRAPPRAGVRRRSGASSQSAGSGSDGSERQGDDATHQGKVGDMTDVAAVDPSRWQGADWTAGGEIAGTGVHGDEPGIHCDAVNGKLARQQGQQGFGDHEQCELRRNRFPLYAHPIAHSHQAAPRMRMGRMPAQSAARTSSLAGTGGISPVRGSSSHFAEHADYGGLRGAVAPTTACRRSFQDWKTR